MDNKIIDNLSCFVDLHLHLDGSLSINCVKKLMEMNNIKTNEDLKTLLEVSDRDKDLNDFLKKFEFPLRLLQTKESIEYATKTLLEELADCGVMYAEIRFAPLNHQVLGLSLEDVVRSAIRGIRNAKIRCNLILCMMRGASYELNKETIDLASKYLNKGVVSIDLAGAEGLYPTKDYEDLFLYAKAQGIPFTIHAGEASDFVSVEDAISFGAKRIGHGIRALENVDTIKKIILNDVCLEICPTSNVCTKIFDKIEEYPFDKIINSNVKFTINTDDMTVCNTNIKKEFKLFNRLYDIDINLFKKIITTSIDYSFSPIDIKNELKEKLDNELSKYN